jgi:hypothetical protein
MEQPCQHVLLPVSGAIPGLEGYECVFCSQLFASYEDALKTSFDHTLELAALQS